MMSAGLMYQIDTGRKVLIINPATRANVILISVPIKTYSLLSWAFLLSEKRKIDLAAVSKAIAAY